MDMVLELWDYALTKVVSRCVMLKNYEDAIVSDIWDCTNKVFSRSVMFKNCEDATHGHILWDF
jgi:hypothetical protein